MNVTAAKRRLPIAPEVLAEQVRLLYLGLPFGLLANLFNASVLAFVNTSLFPSPFVFLWYGALVLSLVIRGVLFWFYRRRPHVLGDDASKRQLFSYLSLLTGLAWGAAEIWLFSSNEIVYQAFLGFIIAGTAAGAVTTLSAHLVTIVLYLSVVLLPLAIQYLLAASPLSNLMALTTILFYVVVMASAVRINRTILENVELRMQADNNKTVIERSQSLLKQTNELAKVGGWEWDSVADRLHWSDDTVLFRQYEAGTIAKISDLLAFIALEARASFMQAVDLCVRERQAIDWQGELSSGANGVRWLRILGKAKIIDGRVVGIIGSYQDISRAKQVEQLKTEFVSTVSHELRTPLTSIHGSLRLLGSGLIENIPAQASELLQIAERNCIRLLALVNDLLDIEKLESGKLMLSLERLNLQQLLRDAIQDNQSYATQYGIHFELQPVGENVYINADRHRFMQVMSNLLSNAAKFSHAGDTVEVSTEVLPSKVKILVVDHGSGISDVFRERIFQKFSQADSSATRKAGGTGLGLSISKALVEKMGGTIGFTSKKNQGSTFYFELPTLV